mgnify:CR=1 FL=1
MDARAAGTINVSLLKRVQLRAQPVRRRVELVGPLVVLGLDGRLDFLLQLREARGERRFRLGGLRRVLLRRLFRTGLSL